MTLQQKIQSKLKRLDTVSDNFAKRSKQVQKNLFKEIVTFLKFTTSKGNIKPTKANLLKVLKIISKVEGSIKNSEFNALVKSFNKEIIKQGLLNESIAKESFNYTAKEFEKELFKQSRLNVISELVSVPSLNGAFRDPIREVILKNVASGGSLVGLIDELKGFVLGDGSLGAFEKHVSTIAYDAFAQIDAIQTKALNDGAGIEWYQYQGGKIKTTRQFCEDRNLKYYHQKEVQAWGDLSNWSGRISGTSKNNIFTNRGGHNCRHALLGRSVFSVPKPVLLRNIASGNFKPTEAQRKLLKI